MGFSSEAIFIKPGLTEKQEIEILKSLGFNDYVLNSEASFEEADSRDKLGVYFGSCNGATYLIFDGVYSTDRKADGLTDIESALVKNLKNHELLSIMNYETSNSYGYHYIKNGKTIRLKEGCHPLVAEDIGDELDIEKGYYVKKEKIEGTQYFFTKSNYKQDEYDKWTHDQIGGSVAFELVRMIAGVSYHHDDLFYSKARQYVPKKIIDSILDNFKNKTTGGNDNSELKDYFPIEYIKEIYIKIKAKLLDDGFIETEDWVLKKENNGVCYTISFKPYKQGNYLIKPSYTYKVEAFRGDWFKKTFGREENRFGNKITNDTQVNIHKVGLNDEYFSIFSNEDRYNVESLMTLINKRLDEVIFPFFKKVDSLEKIAIYNESLFKLDFLLMAGNTAESENVINNTIPNLAVSAKNNKWTAEKISNGIGEFQDRADLIRPDIDIKEMFYSAYDKHEVQKAEEKKVDSTTKQTEPKKTEIKYKPWWRFW
jgi:hypothetical protein